MTYEIEHLDCEALLELESKGKNIRPSPKMLKIIQNKLHQKKYFSQHNLPTTYFKKIKSYTHLLEVMDNSENNETFAVLKSLIGGYDGKGVEIIHRNDIKKFNDFCNANGGEIMYERFLKDKIEISVILSRDLWGNKKVWPVVEMVFDNDTNILDYMFSPSKLPKSTQKKAIELAENTIESFEGVGVFAVEMFVIQNENENGDEVYVYINEIAPRPHNSVHHTINCSKYR